MDRRQEAGGGSWTLLTGHGHVLVEIARNPRARIRDIAAAAGVTERAAQAIITDLEAAGYLTRTRAGRRTVYTVHLDRPFRHPAQNGHRVGPFLELLVSSDGSAGDAAASQARGPAGPPSRRYPLISPARRLKEHALSTLDISTAAGEAGPVLVLSGEADLASVAQLSEALTAQLSGGARHLTVDAAELSFADSASIRALVLAGRALKERGGTLNLARPQPAVARLLELMGADAVLTIRPPVVAEAEPEDA